MGFRFRMFQNIYIHEQLPYIDTGGNRCTITVVPEIFLVVNTNGTPYIFNNCISPYETIKPL